MNEYGFSWAWKRLEEGLCIRRESWRGYLSVELPSSFNSVTHKHLVLNIPDKKDERIILRSDPYDPSQSDLFAEDWEIAR